MGVPRSEWFPWTCSGCGRKMRISGAQVNARKLRCSTSCPRTLERAGTVASMKYADVFNRERLGYDAGHIVEGEVVLDPERGEYVVVDDGEAISSQDILKSLVGKRVRLTCVSFEAIENLERMMAAAPDPKPTS